MSDIPAGFFAKLTASHPYLKLAVFGELGSGKSTLLARIAVGLAKRLPKQPVALLGTERAASDLLPIFESAGVEVLHRETREVADLLETMRLAREGFFSVVLFDSFTHFWESFLDLSRMQLGITTRPLSPTEKGDIKTEWRKRVAAPLVDDPVHYLCSMRASADYESELDQDTLRRESHQVGLRMRAESDTGYEANLVVRVERHEARDRNGLLTVRREAIVEKDRTGTIDGVVLAAEWSAFAPAVEKILARGAAPSAPRLAPPVLFHGPASAGRDRDRATRKALLLEEIEAWLEGAFPGRAAATLTARNKLVAEAFGSLAPSYPKSLALEILETKHALLAGKLRELGHEAPSALLESQPREAPLAAGETLSERFGADEDVFSRRVSGNDGGEAQRQPEPPSVLRSPRETGEPASAVAATVPVAGAVPAVETPQPLHVDAGSTEKAGAEIARSAAAPTSDSAPAKAKAEVSELTPPFGTPVAPGFTLEDALSRLGRAQVRHAQDLVETPDAETAEFSSSIFALAENAHGWQLVDDAFRRVGGEWRGGPSRHRKPPRRKPLTGSQLRRFVLLLPATFPPEVSIVPAGSGQPW